MSDTPSDILKACKDKTTFSICVSSCILILVPLSFTAQSLPHSSLVHFKLFSFFSILFFSSFFPPTHTAGISEAANTSVLDKGQDSRCSPVPESICSKSSFIPYSKCVPHSPPPAFLPALHTSGGPLCSPKRVTIIRVNLSESLRIIGLSQKNCHG